MGKDVIQNVNGAQKGSLSGIKPESPGLERKESKRRTVSCREPRLYRHLNAPTTKHEAIMAKITNAAIATSATR